MQKTVPVNYYPDRCNPPRSKQSRQTFSIFKGPRIHLSAGTNFLTQEQADALAEHPQYQQWHRSWKSVVIQKPVDPDAKLETPKLPQSLAGLNVEQAQEAIEMTTPKDLAILKIWLKAEQRKTVTAALNARIAQLEKGAVA